jgi:hypothetical protein
VHGSVFLCQPNIQDFSGSGFPTVTYPYKATAANDGYQGQRRDRPLPYPAVTHIVRTVHNLLPALITSLPHCFAAGTHLTHIWHSSPAHVFCLAAVYLMAAQPCWLKYVRGVIFVLLPRVHPVS